MSRQKRVDLERYLRANISRKELAEEYANLVLDRPEEFHGFNGMSFEEIVSWAQHEPLEVVVADYVDALTEEELDDWLESL